MKTAFWVLPLLLAGAVPVRAEEPLRVAASIAPIGAIAREVGGELVEVRVLLPPRASPHSFEPGPEAVRALAAAEVVFVVGRGLDLWAERIARGANPQARIERLGHDLPGPEPPVGAAGHGAEHGEDGEDGEEGDPHVWLDPSKAAVIALRIGEILSMVRPAGTDTLHARARVVHDRYETLARECEERLAPVRDVPFVSYHGGLNHLVARFGLSQVALLEPFPGREPSPRDLKKVVETIRSTGARAIFADLQSPRRLAEVVGRETGIPVVEIDPLGGVAGRPSYRDLLESCVDGLVAALTSKGTR